MEIANVWLKKCGQPIPPVAVQVEDDEEVFVTTVTTFVMNIVVADELAIVCVVVSVFVIGKATEPKAVPMTSMMTATPAIDKIVVPFINFGFA